MSQKKGKSKKVNAHNAGELETNQIHLSPRNGKDGLVIN